MANQFNIQGIDRLDLLLQNFPSQVRRKIDEEIVKTVVEINAEQVSLAPVDRGPIRQNLTWQHTGPQQYKIICNVPYAAYVEFGTRLKYRPINGVDASEYRGSAGASSGSLFQNILAWVRRKNIAATLTRSGRRSRSRNALQKEEEAARLITRSIMKNGIKPHPFFFTPFLTRRQKLVDNINNALRRL